MTQDNKEDRIISINRQYIKDLSFESPKVPQIFLEKNIQPKIDIAIDINATKLQNEVFEVELNISADAKLNNETVFIVELVYAGIFHLKAFEETLLEEALFVECPTLIFPFARRIIAEVVRDAGFPILMLSPINFALLYKNKKDKIRTEKK